MQKWAIRQCNPYNIATRLVETVALFLCISGEIQEWLFLLSEVPIRLCFDFRFTSTPHYSKTLLIELNTSYHDSRVADVVFSNYTPPPYHAHVWNEVGQQ